jgi:hypothetical protein
MSTTTTHDDLAMRRAYGAVAAVGVMLCVGAALLFSVKLGLSALVGSFIAVANLWVLSRAVRNLLSGSGSRTPWALVAAAKFFVLLGVTYVLVRSGVIAPLGLALGFGALPVGILLSGLASPRTREETDHA